MRLQEILLLLVIAALAAYGGVRALRFPATTAAIRFRPWTYRRIDHTPTVRDIRSERLLGALLLVIAAAVVAFLLFELAR